MELGLDAELAQVRARKASKIPAQAQQAALLEAIELALKEERQPLVPPAYFASLVSVLDRDAGAQAAGLLAIVVPHVSQSLLVSKLDFVVSRLAPVLVDSEADTAHVRAAIGVLEAALTATEPAVWSSISISAPGPLRTFAGLVALAQDSRPKIRRRSLEAVPRILASHDNHPGGLLAIDASLEALENVREPSSVVHGLQLLKAVLGTVSASDLNARFNQICETLLKAVRSANQYVVIAALEAFNSMFTSERTPPARLQQAVDLLSTNLRPAATDKTLMPTWCAVIAEAYAAMAAADPRLALSGTVGAVELLSSYIAVPPAVPEVAASAGNCLQSIFTVALQPEPLLEDSSSESPVLAELAERLFALLHTRYHDSWPVVCGIIATFLDKADILSRKVAKVADIVRVVGALRSGELREGADLVMGAAIRNLGPELVCELVPLQLDQASGSGRAWMLPLLRDNVQHATLAHFITFFVPLANKFEEAAQRIQDGQQAKIVATIAEQIWMLWPRYCDLPTDLPKALTKDVVGLVLARLYEHPTERPALCQGLRLLVQSNLVYSESADEVDDPILLSHFSPNAAKRSLKHLSTEFGSDILKALLNVFSTMTPVSRSYVLDTIESYLSVIPDAAVDEMFNQVSAILAAKIQENDLATAQTMMDIVVAIAAFLRSDTQHKVFLNLFQVMLKATDGLLQKKAYRAFVRLADASADEVLSVKDLILSLAETSPPPARRARLEALGYILSVVSDDDIGAYVFSILPETILACRDPNEKSRETAFELLVAIGRRMSSGTAVIDHSQMPGIEDDDKIPGSIADFFEMAMAGLVGASPHMVSATVTGLSRVFYEFKDALPLEKQWEYAELIWMLLESPNREIVGSVLGFVKVSILVLPPGQLAERLPQLLRSLLEWSDDHKNQFKAKVRHIIERLIRREGYDAVAAAFPEAHVKLLHNIHKSKERAKRKKANAPDDEERNERPKKKFDNEFDQALYGSSDESDAEDDGGDSDAGNGHRNSRSKNQKSQNKSNNRKGQYIVNADGDPIDLLDESALAHISSSKPQAAPKKEMRHKLREKDGKFIINDDKTEAADAKVDLDTKEALSAYVDAVKSGPVRTRRGKFKFKRGNKVNGDDAEERPVKRAPAGVQKRQKQFPRRRNL